MPVLMGSEEKQPALPDLRRLFSACDLNRSGIIEFEDFAKVCKDLNLRSSQVRTIFNKLDVDHDGCVNFSDFVASFQEVSQTLDLTALTPVGSNDGVHNQQQDAWEEFEEHFRDELPYLKNCERVSELYQQIHGTSDFILLQQFEALIADLIRESKAHNHEIQQLEAKMKRSEDIASEHIKELEEDMQQQIVKNEARIREEERLRQESLIAELQQRHEEEMFDIQTTNERLKKQEEAKRDMDSRQDGVKLRDQIGDLSHENLHLKKTLLEAQTNISVLQAELDKIKNQLDDEKRQHAREINKQLYDSNNEVRAMLFSTANAGNKSTSSSGRRVLPVRPPENNVNGLPSKNSFSFSEEDDLASLDSYSTSQKNLAEVAKWAQKYLGNKWTISPDVVDGDDLSSDYDSDQSNASGETVQHSLYLPSDVEVSDVKSEFNVEADTASGVWKPSRPASRGSSVASSRKRLPVFSPKKVEVEMSPEVSQNHGPLYRLVLAGDAGSGKSSFLLRLCSNEYRSDITTTLGVDFRMKKLLVDGDQTTLQIWDTAGQERFRSIAKSYFRKAHGVLLLYDVTSERSFLNVREWVDEVKNSTEKSIPIILIGNKVDMRAEMPESNCVHTAHGEKLAMAYNSLFCETSAKDGTNVVEAVLHLAREVKKTVDLDNEKEEAVTKLIIPDKLDSLSKCCKM
ncbi:ras and EF-hand domain-containing protein-like isoform X2 [Protopterus annectens]|uniref:ras and EF-hand domain-containing protein-like isoform X2 n=1 Tax=Protopterus annectens TaxID=7888 RepID=UPI001CFBC126|nr:ras and EF-hand domain-containing protein-like isoform X2 [Protopterus annectens]